MVTTTQFWFVEPYLNFSFEIMFGGMIILLLFFLVIAPLIILMIGSFLDKNDY